MCMYSIFLHLRVFTWSRTISYFSFIHITVVFFFYDLSSGEQTENIQRMIDSVVVIFWRERKKMGQQFSLLTRPSTFQKYLRPKGSILCFEASQSNQNILLNTLWNAPYQKTIIILINIITFVLNLCYKCCLGDVLKEVLDIPLY